MKNPDLLQILDSGNCSACGACVLAGTASALALNAEGHLRPVPAESPDRAAPALSTYCPAVTVDRPAPAEGSRRDPFFGDYLGVWSGWASDPELRFKGSSGGALSAIARSALEHDVDSVVMTSGEQVGSRTSAHKVDDPGRVGDYASSRYAPVSALPLLPAAADSRSAVVCRPCEASALRRLRPTDTPLVLSFFCAGVPSQWATDDLIATLGGDAASAQGLRYRGNGWPGLFSFRTPDGEQRSATYDESWGAHLGRQVQPRCKICVDGVGESADVVAGDIWESDEKGFPLFDEAPGISVIIARTPRGLALVQQAISSGHLVLAQEQDITELRDVQPAQVARRQFVAARLAGRRLAGRRVPRYRGFGLTRLTARRPREAVRQLRGTYRRSK